MKKKFFVLILFFILILIWALLKKDIDIYLSLAGYSPYEKVDMNLEIDQKQIFNDTVYYSLFPKKVKYSLRSGFHKISVSSNEARIKEEKIVLILIKQHIIIEFYNKMENIREQPEFKIESRFDPFYIE